MHFEGIFCIFLLGCLSSFLIGDVDARKKNTHLKTTAAEDSSIISGATTQNEKQQHKSGSKSSNKAVPISASASLPSHYGDLEFSIEDVDEEKIDQILRDSTKNLVVFFYDGRIKCPGCGDALTEVEEIDDDIEATGYIEVVKTDDRRVARESGVSTFPALIYFRRNNPIFYDGEFKDSEVVLRWLRSHDEIVTWELTDDNFESKTDSHSPDESALDWFVMFYDSEEPDCNAFIAVWETVAHKLRGLVHVGKVDSSVSDDVTERFRIDDNQCPTFLLFHRGKMYRYNDPARDVNGLRNFALHKYKDQRGHRVPEPPTALEHFYEHLKERVTEVLEDNQKLTVICVIGTIFIVTIALIIKAYKIKHQQASASSSSSTTSVDKKTF